MSLLKKAKGIFRSDRPDFSIRQLSIKHTKFLQTLYGQCNNYALLTYGKPFSASAAKAVAPAIIFLRDKSNRLSAMLLPPK